jgi:hypothetical protein
MSKIVRKGKQNRHEKITQVMLSGKPVTPEEIALTFKGTDQEAVLYRLSTNIYNIRLDGGIVKVIKNGRKVQAYQLVNHEEFSLTGRYVGKVLKPNQVKDSGKTEVKAEVKNQVKTEVTAEVTGAPADWLTV